MVLEDPKTESAEYPYKFLNLRNDLHQIQVQNYRYLLLY